MRPLARRDGLVVRDLNDETIVYDRERHQAHCLNRTAGIVLQHCDGTRGLEEIAALLDEGDDPEAREAIVRLALEQLSAARLLVAGDEQHGAPALGRDDGRTSRRDLLRLAALAVPTIASIVAPTPAQAASVCWSHEDCFNNPSYLGQQCSQLNNGTCDGSHCCDASQDCTPCL